VLLRNYSVTHSVSFTLTVRLPHRVPINDLLQSSCYGLISQQYYVAVVTQNIQGEQWQIIHSDVVHCINQTHVMSLSTAAAGFDEPSPLMKLSHILLMAALMLVVVVTLCSSCSLPSLKQSSCNCSSSLAHHRMFSKVCYITSKQFIITSYTFCD